MKTKTGIFIKTCKKDSSWLKSCLFSINKHCSNFDGLCIVTDTDHDEIDNLIKYIKTIPISVHKVEVPKIKHTCQDGIGYLWMQNIKLMWPDFCDFDSVLHIDSDFVILSNLDKSFYEINKTWKWFVRPWSHSQRAIVHKDPTEKLIQQISCYEHMPIPGWILDKNITLSFHKWLNTTYGCSWWEYLVYNTKKDWGNTVSQGTSRGSSVYNAYGGFLELTKPSNYTFVDVVDNNWQNLPPIKQYWSWLTDKPKTHKQH
jgi:hypothetical protein